MRSLSLVRGQMATAIMTCGIIVTVGCVLHRDVSNDTRYPTDYVVGGVYRVKPTAWVDIYDNNLFLLFHEGPYAFTSNIEGHEIAGVIDAGTSIVITKMELRKGFETGHTVFPWGRFLDGRFIGQSVNLVFVSQTPYRDHVELAFINTNVLEFMPASSMSPAPLK